MMLTVAGLSVRYGMVLAVDGLDLVVPDGEIVAILGPSGSGKSSVLRAVAGLEPVAAGTVHWDDTDLTAIPPHRRDFGLMFQDHALFGHQDVAANVGFGLRTRGWSAADRRARTTEMLALVGLAGAGARAVDRLSGGEQQRVALARALAPAPRLLMLDEPLASVDRERRAALGGDLHRIVRTARTATLLVTHDLDEAFTLADSVVVLDAGRAVRAGPAEEVWRDPGSVVAARFLGVTTDLALVGDGRTVATPWGPLASAIHGPVTLGLRPAHLRIQPGAAVPGTVRNVWFHLDHYAVEVETAFGRMTAAAPARPALGSPVTVAADLNAAMIFTA